VQNFKNKDGSCVRFYFTHILMILDFMQKTKVCLIIKNKEGELLLQLRDEDLEIGKWVLNKGYVFADDLNENSFILVREVKTEFEFLFPEKINFGGKEFEFLYNARAVAEEIDGEEIFLKGDAESFWDYKASDGSYLSLDINEKTNKRMDDCGRIVVADDIWFK